MKSVCLTLGCLLTFCAIAQMNVGNPFFVAGLFGTPPPPEPGGVLQLLETFEKDEFDSFIDAGLSGGINGNYTVWKFQGSESMIMTNTGTFNYVYRSTAQRTTNCMSFVCIVRQTTGLVKATLSTLGVADRGTFFTAVGGSWKIEHGSSSSPQTVTWGLGTTNYVWLEYVDYAEDATADGIFNAWVRTNTTVFPGGAADLTITTGNATLRPDSFSFQVNNGESWEVDYIRVWDSRPSNWDF